MTTRSLLRLYPRAWRERYGEEVLALIEQSRVGGLALAVDLLRGCAAAWWTTGVDSMSLNSRQQWLALFAATGAALVGSLLAGAIALMLPAAPRLGHWIADISRTTVIVAVAVYWYRSFRKGARPRMTDAIAFGATLTINAAIIRAYGTWNSPSILASINAGREPWIGLWTHITLAAVALFYLIGAAIAPILWPAVFQVSSVDDAKGVSE